VRRSVTRSAPIGGALAVLGFGALVVQVLLLRELMMAWRGNEMSLGITLAVWLALGGAGSLLGAGRVRRAASPASWLVRGLFGLAILAPAALLSARVLRLVLGYPAGELAGLPPLALASLVSLAPYAMLSGAMFAVAVASLAGTGRSGAGAAGAAYVLEAAGAVAGGLLLSFVLLAAWEPTRIALLVSTLALATAALVGRTARMNGPRAGLAGAAPVIAALAALALLASPLAGRLDDATVAWQWRDLGFRGQTNSIYGRIIATLQGSQRSIYQSGVLVASAPDRLSAEETAHVPLLEHPRPGRVLVLGGGLAGVLDEVLKHPTVRSVDYVELDPALLEVARTHLGPGGEALSDPRVSTRQRDGRLFVKEADGPYDVVIVGAPDPTTAQLNRFYTAEFFAEVRGLLAPDGVLGLSVTSSENYVGRELAAFLACLRATLFEAFEDVVLLPGDPCHALAAARPGVLTRDPEILSARVVERGLDVVFVRGYSLRDRLRPERVAALDESVDRAEVTVNTDLGPRLYYLSLVLWNRQFSGSPRILLGAQRVLTPAAVGALAIAIAAAFAIPALRRRRAAAWHRRAVVLAIFIVGLTELSLEVAALTAFQSIYGYVYHRVALLVAAFMAGLALGGWAGFRAEARGAGPRSFAALQAGICVIPLALAAAVAAVAGLPPDRAAAGASAFPLLVVAAAFLAGMQFPIAAGLHLRQGGHAGAESGRLYGADLLGAAIGAPVAAVFMIPVLGLAGSMAALALLNAAVFVTLVAPLVRLRRE